MNTFHLIVSSPDGNLFEGDVVRLSVREPKVNLLLWQDTFLLLPLWWKLPLLFIWRMTPKKQQWQKAVFLPWEKML